MAHINLLPWREQLRKDRQRNFFVVVGIAAIISVLVVGAVHIHILTLIDHQESRNNLLKQEIAPVHEPPRPGDVRDSLADITAARNILGYEPQINLEEGLARSIDYYKSIAGAQS